MAITTENGKYTSKDRELQSIVQFCFDASQEFFEDRCRNKARFEGRREKREARQAENDHEYISTAGSEMIEQKAAFTTEAVTNFGHKMFTVGTYNNIEAARDAKASAELLNYYMSNIPVTEQGYMLHKNMYLYGTSVAEVYFRTLTIKEPVGESRVQLTVDEEGTFGSIFSSKYEEVEYLKQPVFRQVRLQNFWPDPEITDGTIDTARFICVRELRTASSVRKNKVRFDLKNLSAAIDCPIPDRMSFTSSAGGLRKRLAEYDIENIRKRNQRSEATKSDPIVELITIYRPGTVQFMVNGKVVSDEIVIYPEIRYPFAIFRNQPEDGEFWGRADLELVKNNIDFYEELINLVHDKYLMNLKPVLFADAMSMDLDQIEKFKKAKAGDVIAIDNFTSESVKEFKQDTPDASTIAFAEGFLSEVKKALAINPMMEAENPGSGIRTEGSLQLFQRIGSTRMQTQLNIVTKCWEEIGRLMLRMAKIFADEEVYLSVTGALGDTVEGFIDPRKVNTNTKFKIKLGAVADPKRDTRVAQMLQYIEACKSLDSLGIFRGEQALAETAEHMDIFNDPVSLWETDPEVIKARRELMATTAGREQPSSLTGIPSPSSVQAAQPQEQQPQPAQEARPAQSSDLPTPTEGVQ